MRIVIGSDHAGFSLKKICINFLKDGREHDVLDIGVFNENSANYPLIAHEAITKIKDGLCDSGILICGTGIGMSITANRYKGIRAALCHNELTVRMSRAHNDANILVMGARVITEEEALRLVKIFIDTSFEGGRHLERINMIDCWEEAL